MSGKGIKTKQDKTKQKTKQNIQKTIKEVISVVHFIFFLFILTQQVKHLNFPFDFSVGV